MSYFISVHTSLNFRIILRCFFIEITASVYWRNINRVVLLNIFDVLSRASRNHLWQSYVISTIRNSSKLRVLFSEFLSHHHSHFSTLFTITSFHTLQIYISFALSCIQPFRNFYFGCKTLHSLLFLHEKNLVGMFLEQRYLVYSSDRKK